MNWYTKNQNKIFRAHENISRSLQKIDLDPKRENIYFFLKINQTF